MTVLAHEITFEKLDEVLATLEEVAEDQGVPGMMAVLEEIAGPLMSTSTPIKTLEALTKEADSLAENYDLSMNQRSFFEEAYEELTSLR